MAETGVPFVTEGSSTEASSKYDGLEKLSTAELLVNMNQEDQSVPLAVAKELKSIEAAVEGAYLRVREGGRVFYIGAGTSGRLGILDASECPPTFGVSPDVVIGLIAGGDQAIRSAVEHAEDSFEGAWQDLQAYEPTARDTVIGVAASGRTPYVVGGLREARKNGLFTACITCNPNAPVAAEAEVPIVVVVGPEFVTGSTRLKSGTAQKLVLNMFSTVLMIRLGKVKGNKMVDMQLANAKLKDRGTRMVMEETGIEDYARAQALLLELGSVRAACEHVAKQ